MAQIAKSSGVLVNPAVDTVILDTGQLKSGMWHFQVHLSPSADQQVAVEWVAQDGTTKLLDHRIFLNADTPYNFPLILSVNLNDKLIIREKTTSLVGSVAASIIGQG